MKGLLRVWASKAVGAAFLIVLAAGPVAAPAAGALFHDQVRQAHNTPLACPTCRYITLKADGQQQYRMTRVAPTLPSRVNDTTEFLLLVDGAGGVSQYLPRAESRRLTGWEIQAAVSTSAAKFCDFNSAGESEFAVEYYEPGHEQQSISATGVALTQGYALAARKNGTLYVFRDEESVACGTPAHTFIASRLIDLDSMTRPGFSESIQEQVARSLKKYYDLPMIPEPTLPPAPIITREEFETSQDFNRRVDAERKAREDAIYKLQQDFRRKVEQRNQLISAREASRDAYTDQLTRQATLDALGKLILRNPDYDADRGLMYADVVSTKTDFSRRIAVSVPMENNQARVLKNRIADADISLRLDVDRNSIALRDVTLGIDGRSYAGTVTTGAAQARVAQSIDLRALEGGAALVAAPAQLQSPDLVDRRRLSVDGAPVQDDVRVPVGSMPAAPDDATKWLFVVAVENYENADPVLYARNSAELLVSAFQKKFGISARNTYALIEEKATAGAFKDKFATLMRNVRKGDTVYFYYSGHGIPDQKSDEAYILPRDKMVGFVAGEEYLRLSKIYEQLAGSEAAQVYAFIDSCFSGKTDNVSNFKGVAPGIFRAPDVVVNSQKLVVITAGKYDQFSNAYVEKGHRMFSYFLLKSLTKPRPSPAPVDIQTLYQEIAVGVRDASNAKGDAYLQEPQLLGNAAARL